MKRQYKDLNKRNIKKSHKIQKLETESSMTSELSHDQNDDFFSSNSSCLKYSSVSVSKKSATSDNDFYSSENSFSESLHENSEASTSGVVSINDTRRFLI